MIRTSYFARIARLAPNDPIRRGAVSIARWPPSWFGPVKAFPSLFPPADLIRAAKAGTVTWEEYEVRYRSEVLAKLDPRRVAALLRVLTPSGVEPVLLCYEPPGKPCHRHLAATFLVEGAGEPVEEVQTK